MHARQCVGNLLGRPTPQHKITDHAPQRAMRVQLGQRPRRNAADLTSCLGSLEGIAIDNRAIASELTANGAGAAPEQEGNGSLAQTLLHKGYQSQAIFWLHVVYREVICANYLRFRCCTSGLRQPSIIAAKGRE